MEDILNRKSAEVKTYHIVNTIESGRNVYYLCISFLAEGSLIKFKGVEITNLIEIDCLEKAEEILKNEKIEKYLPATKLEEAYLKRFTNKLPKKP